MKKGLFFIIFLIWTVLLACSKKDGPLAIFKKISEIHLFGGSQNEEAQAVVATQDGGYLVLANTQSSDGDITGKTTEDYDLWLLKFDANHELLWQKIIGHANNDKGNSIIPTPDGGWLIAGSTQDAQPNQNNITQVWLVKIDSQAQLLWEKTYGYAGVDVAYDILATTDGGFLVSGIIDVTASNGAGNTKSKAQKHAGGDYWVLKVDAAGNLQWSRYFGGSYTDTAQDALALSDGSFLILGTSDSEDVDISKNKGTYDLWLLRISADGTMLWEKSFGGTQIDEGVKMQLISSSEVMLVGTTRSTDLDAAQNKGGADVWVLTLDIEGAVLREKTYGGSSFDTATSLNKTTNGHYLITGNSRSADYDLTQNQGYSDAWVFTIDRQGALQWQVSVGGPQLDTANDAALLADGTLVVVGTSNSSFSEAQYNNGFSDVLIFTLQ
ncbi:MAG: hypothetical protein ACO3MZ_03110 [Flavobacteriaceae bacterium]